MYTFLILHGWNLSSDRFLPLSEVLKKQKHTVWSLDFPGFGKANPPSRSWHVVDYAEFVKEFIERNHIKNPIIIGHSFGGRVALKFTELYPHVPKALVLSGTPGFSPVAKKKLLVFFILAKIGNLIFSVPPLNLLSDWARRWLYYVAGAREFFRAEGVMRDTFKFVVQDDLISAMESVYKPTLLLWGDFDVLVPVSIARRMLETMQNATLKVIPEADHGVPFKEPNVFTEYVLDFLKSQHIS